MAKSTRSKVKRHFRAKKREEGVYAATEAARLHRLSMKLKTLATAAGGDDEMPEGDDGAENAEIEGIDDSAGWWSSPDSIVDDALSWFVGLALIDPDDITPERIYILSEPCVFSAKVRERAAPSGKPLARERHPDEDPSDCPEALNHLVHNLSSDEAV